MSTPSQPPRCFFLQTERLGFSTWAEDDLPLARALWGDPQVTHYICAAGTLSEQDIADRLQREISNDALYRIQYWPLFELSTGEFVGCGGLRPYEPDADALEIGVHLLPAYWGQGLALEASQAIIRYAFEALGAKRLFAGHHPANANSGKVLKKLGFRYLRDEYYAPTGLYHPSYILDSSDLPDVDH